MTRRAHSWLPVRHAARGLACAAGLLMLVACGGPKNFYAGADARAERAAAEVAAAAPPAEAKLETQATYIKLVEQMQRDGLWFASLAHLDALERRWGEAPATIRLRADALRRTDQTSESRRQYERLRGTPLEPAALHGLGLVAGSEGDYPQAVQLLETARRLNPTDGVLLSDLGYAHLRTGRIASARVPLMQAAQLLPTDQQVRVNLALYLVASQQEEQAQALMTSAAFSPATRAAIRQSALELQAKPTGAQGAQTSQGAPAVQPAETLPPPLTLRTSGWTHLVPVRDAQAAPDLTFPVNPGPSSRTHESSP